MRKILRGSLSAIVAAFISILFCLAAWGWGFGDLHMNYALFSKEPLYTHNTRVALNKPFYQGNFGYWIPLAVPEGLNGLAPTLGLVYNSEAGESFLGVGWTLVGYNYIRRSERLGVPWYDEWDHYILMLDGKEYLLDGNGVFEQAAWLKAEKAGDDWVIYDSDGTKLYFQKASEFHRGIYSWVLTRIEDTNGNKIIYEYDNSLLAMEGVAYLVSIRYRDSNDIEQKIELIYESTSKLGYPTGQEKPPSYSYWAGRPVWYSKRLTTVKAGEITYTITYRQSLSSKRLLLAKIMTSDDEIVFSYQSDNFNPYQPWRFTSDWGLPFLTGYVQGIGIDSIKDYHLITEDFDNDGLPDILVMKHHQYISPGYLTIDVDFLPQIFLNNGENGWVLAHDFQQNASLFHRYYKSEGDDLIGMPADGLFSDHKIEQRIIPRVYDLNGDGFKDLILTVHYFSGSFYTFKMPVVNYPTAPYNWGIYEQHLPVGDVVHWTEQEHLVFLNDGKGNFHYKEKRQEDFSGNTDIPDFIDFDGDGLVDPMPFRGSILPIVTDINGDRYPDLFSKGSFYLNQGDGTFQAVNYIEQVQFFQNLCFGIDVNGNGLPGPVNFSAGSGLLSFIGDSRYDLYLGSDSRYCQPLQEGGEFYKHEVFADVDNNGFPDLITLSGAYLNQSQPDLLTEISGHEEINIKYERVPVSSFYFKESDWQVNPERHGPILYRWVVAEISTENNTVSYSYEGGVYDLILRSFNGFSKIIATDEYGETVYTYDPYSWKKAGLFLSISDPYASILCDYRFDIEEDLIGLKIVAKPINGPAVIVDDTYDEDGNLVKQEETIVYKDISETFIREFSYSKNIDAHIVDTVQRIVEKCVNGDVLQESIFYYDELENLGLVTKGNVTRIDDIIKPENTGSENISTYFSYNQKGQLVTVADSKGAATVSELLTVNKDYKKRIIRNALGHEFYQLISTETGLVIKEVDENGAVTEYDYYPDRRLRRVTRPDKGFTEYEYYKDHTGSKTITKTLEDREKSLLQWEEEHFDRRGRLIKTIQKQVRFLGKDGAGPYETIGRPVVTEMTYNRWGLVEKESLPYFEGDTPCYIEYIYENTYQHRLLEVRYPDGGTVLYSYDDANQRMTVTDQNGNRTETKETYEYLLWPDGRRITCRVVTVIDPLGYTTRAYYDFRGNLLLEIDPNGREKRYWYDSLGRVYRSIDPYKGQMAYVYGSRGELLKTIDEKGQVISYEYDLLARMTAQVYPGGHRIECFYDLASETNPVHTYGIGRLCAYSDQSGITRLGYDTMGNLIYKEKDGYVLAVKYDLLNRIKTISYPGNYLVSYDYDHLGLAQVRDRERVLAQYNKRDAFGQAREIKHGNGLKSLFDYHPENGYLRELKVITAFEPEFSTLSFGTQRAKMEQPAGGLLLNLAYGFDAVGNITSIHDYSPRGTSVRLDESFTYDRNNRLIGATGPYGALSYQYDAVGNFLNKEGIGFYYGDPKHPYAPTASTGKFTAQYDANGNMIRKTDFLGNRFEYVYDEQNQLIRVTKNNTYTEEYVYDATGYRVARLVDGIRTDYLYWGKILLYEKTGGKAIKYVWAEDKLIAKVEETGVTYFHHDHLGSSKLQTAEDGTVLSIDVTRPYGPRICDEVFQEDFTSLSRVDMERSLIKYESGLILPPEEGRSGQNVITGYSNNIILSPFFIPVKAARFRLSEESDRQVTVVFSLTGMGKLRVTGEDGHEYYARDYAGTGEVITEVISLEDAPFQEYMVLLELAGSAQAPVAQNNLFEVKWGASSQELGELYIRPYHLNYQVTSIRLSWVGEGVTFLVSTDGHNWERVENGKTLRLRNPGNSVQLKAHLKIEEGTFLTGYSLEINPASYSLFTGKTLEESTGLIYFGRRWYDPELGRFITVDPLEDGGNWYQYCLSNPIMYMDPEGLDTFPAGPWKRPGKMPIQLYIGKAIHEAIGIYYKSHSYNQGKEIYLNETTIRTILIEMGIDPGTVYRELGIKPDIFNKRTMELYEIKSVYEGLMVAVTEVLRYARILNYAVGGVKLGTTTNPGTRGIVPAPWGFAVFSSPVRGVILYRYRRGRAAQTAAASVPLEAVSGNRAQSSIWDTNRVRWDADTAAAAGYRREVAAIRRTAIIAGASYLVTKAAIAIGAKSTAAGAGGAVVKLVTAAGTGASGGLVPAAAIVIIGMIYLSHGQ